MENYKDHLVNFINSLPYSVGLALKNLLIHMFKFSVFICTNITKFYLFIISLFKHNSEPNEIHTPSAYSYEEIFKINNLQIVELIQNRIKNVFYIDNKIYLVVNDKKEICNLLNNIKTNNSLWIKINTLYGEYENRLCLVPNFILYLLLLFTNEFTLYKKYRCSNSRVHFGSESGCRIEIWLNSEIHYLGNSKYKRKVYKIASPQWLREKNLEIDSNNINDINLTPYKSDFPIDIVITWVDNSDPEWNKKLENTRNKFKNNELLGTSANESRFRNFNELKYSLRSICMYGNFFRKIFLVTEGHLPNWLNINSNRIEVVSHKQIFPKGDFLPTFNSHAIESRLHHIPGLQENYLYFNDDIFLCRPLNPDKFFLNKDISCFFSTQSSYIGLNTPNKKDLPIDASAKNNRDFIYNKYGKIVTNKFEHVPIPQIKSVLFEIEKLLKKELLITANNKFRMINDISLPSSLYHHYSKNNGMAVQGDIKNLYIDISNKNSLGLLKKLSNTDVDFQPDVLCINDVDLGSDNIEDYSERLQYLLDEYFPVKSEFEK